MKSIRVKIRLCMSMTLLFAMVVLAVVTIFLNYNSTLDTLQQTMTSTVQIAVQHVEKELAAYRQTSYEIGCLPALSDEETSVKAKKAIIDQRVRDHGLQNGNVIGIDGVSIFDGKDYSDYLYVQKAMEGETYVSVPLVDKSTGEVSIIVAAPIWKNGVSNSTVTGVVFFEPEETFLNDIVSNLKASNNGSAYMLDAEGTIIAHKDMEKVKNQHNTQELARKDDSMADLAKMEAAMVSGQEGFGEYSYDGVIKYMAYAPVQGTDGWSLGVNVPRADVMKSTKEGIQTTVVVLVVCLLLATPIAGWLSKGISRPLKASAERMQALVEGDLHAPVMTSNAKDETGMLLRSIQDMVAGLQDLIGDMDNLLDNMADGNFDVYSRCRDRYVGDFSGLLKSVRHLNYSLSDTMRGIDSAADQVADGSEQLSGSAQAMAQGATEQASSVEELDATINAIAEQVDTTAEHARTARAENQQSHELIGACSANMAELVNAMQLIEEKSREMDKVIKTIEDIAFQTNILALNASVEAARAGVAGKGFAVVADEVRNLATKSAEASNDTAQLLEETMNAVKTGIRLSDKTDQALHQVVLSAEKVLDVVAQIDKATDEQSMAIAQVVEGIGQVSEVVQTNSATSQEIAAATEELSGQADFLKRQVSRFTLRSSDS